MTYCLSIYHILKNKISFFKENTELYKNYFKENSFIESFLCYVRETNINSAENLKFVLESIINDYLKKYIETIKEILNESNISIFCKDFRFLIQASCSINKTLLRPSQLFLREFILFFPQLVFQNDNLIAFSEAINVLYKKIKSEFESISTVMQTNL